MRMDTVTEIGQNIIIIYNISPNADYLMNTTESFEDHEASVFYEFVETSDQEEVR